jgi:hypothetical protein
MLTELMKMLEYVRHSETPQEEWGKGTRCIGF